MKKLLMMLAFVATVVLMGCGKDDDTSCTPKNPADEEASIIAYNTSKGITATKHPSGMYYQIVNPGTGVMPTVNSRVSVQYTGQLLDGTTFDSNTSTTGYTEYLSNLIAGWQYGLPLIRVGGTIKLIIPSAYAYGCRATGGIPANSVLYFEVKLLNVN